MILGSRHHVQYLSRFLPVTEPLLKCFCTYLYPLSLGQVGGFPVRGFHICAVGFGPFYDATLFGCHTAAGEVGTSDQVSQRHVYKVLYRDPFGFGSSPRRQRVFEPPPEILQPVL